MRDDRHCQKVNLKRWLYLLYWIEGKLGTLIARKKRFGKLVQIGIKQKDNTYLYVTADSSHWNDFEAVAEIKERQELEEKLRT